MQLIALNINPRKSDYWRRCVTRMAHQFAHHIPEEIQDFYDRQCACGRQVTVSRHIWPESDEYLCDACTDDPFYAPGARDYYWWAHCLNGIDPDGRGEPLSPRRRVELEQACREVGLEFGSIT